MGESKKRSRTPGKPGAAKPDASFEDSVGRLEQIVQRLESGELPLEDAVALFEEGVRLARATQRQLEAAERRVEQLLGVDEDGNPIVRELETDDEE
jgi:exodeoxyribonuclease VII small subunit